MKTIKTLSILTVGFATGISQLTLAADFHVATSGKDSSAGSADAPFLTISKAAELAQPGDVIKVHPGIYRERIDPPRGGTSDEARITYEAVGDGEVILKGSEIAKGWEPVEGTLWKLSLPNTYFGEFNPYSDLIQGDWYESRQPYHSGAVFLNGHWLREAASKDTLMGKETKDDANRELLSLEHITLGGVKLQATDATSTSRDFAEISTVRGGKGIGPMKAGDWLVFKDVDLSETGADSVAMNTGSPVGGGWIEVRLGDPEGELLGTVDAMLTAEWTFFATYRTNFKKKITGKQDIALVVRKRTLPPERGTVIGRWFGEVDDTSTTIWADFQGKDPNKELVEINKRQAIFYPTKNHIDYLTLRGFTMEQAATAWSPPTAEQIGLVGTNWSKGWVIENNTIRYSVCTGITLGKHGDEYDNTYDYFRSIRIGLQRGWNKGKIGSHVVRNNHIHDCGQAGIVGSLGSAFCLIEGNEIHDIRKDHQFGGCETAGVKLHGAVDTIVRNNHIYRCEHWGGLWLDWMCQGSRVSGNLLHDNSNDMMFEMNHGPMLIDNNLLLSKGPCLLDASAGGAYVHNIFGGDVRIWDYLTNRKTPYFKPHSTDVILVDRRDRSDFGALDGTVAKFKAEVAGTESDAVYQSVRYGLTEYRLDIPAGEYQVTLQFNEPFFSNAGLRVFGVNVQGNVAAEKLDVFAVAGKNKAHDLVLKNQVVTDKPLTVSFKKFSSDPIISGIKVEGKTKEGADYHYAVNCGGVVVGDYLADFKISPEAGEVDVFKLPANFGKTVDQSDDRFINNLFLGGAALSQYDKHDFKIHASGNVYVGKSKPTKQDQAPVLDANTQLPVLEEEEDGWYLSFNVQDAWLEGKRAIITSADLGVAVLPEMRFEHIDGSDYVISEDYTGKKRDANNSTVGAFQVGEAKKLRVKVWDKKK